jgi:hypothetical protein
MGAAGAELRLRGIEEVPGNGDLSAKTSGNAEAGAFDLLHQSGEIIAGAGDGGDAERGGLPGHGFVHFCDGDVECVPELFLETTDDLAAVLEGVGVLDAKLEEHGGDGHGRNSSYRRAAGLRLTVKRALDAPTRS